MGTMLQLDLYSINEIEKYIKDNTASNGCYFCIATIVKVEEF